MKQNAEQHLSKSLNRPNRPKALLAAFLLTTGFLAKAQSPLPDDSNPGANGNPFTFSVQPDGKILVGGQFTTLGGEGRTNLARLNANGTLDTGFNPPVSGPGFLGPFPGGFSGIGVASMALQVDGKILVGGTFTSVAGQPRTNLARLNPDGTLDNTFVFAVTGEWRPCVYALAIQADGKTLVGGLFTELGGQPRTNLARLNPEGTLDNTFNPGLFDLYDSAHALAACRT